jgi:hypothetical protein
MRGPSATYLYCVVKAEPKRKLRLGGAGGLSGATTPRLIEAGDGYHLVAADAPLRLYDGPAIEVHLRDLEWVGGRAAEHEAVVEEAAALGTVIPMKLFTLFSSDDRALEHVKKMRRSLDRVVDRIAGCEEWGLRVLFDEARAARAASTRSKKVTTGREFLMRKKALEDEKRSFGARGRAVVDDLYDRIAKSVRGARRRPAPNRELAGRVLLDAVFLVPTPSVKKVKATVASSAKKLVEDGFDVTLTGPWPAYSFIGGR